MTAVFICSPYRGDVEKNRKIALALCKKAFDNYCAPFAPHLLYPQMLDDSNPEQRELGIGAGLEFLKCCDLMYVYADCPPSGGMQTEMMLASQEAVKMIFWTAKELGL
jgi:hypothetical protein